MTSDKWHVTTNIVTTVYLHLAATPHLHLTVHIHKHMPVHMHLSPQIQFKPTILLIANAHTHAHANAHTLFKIVKKKNIYIKCL